MKSICNRFGALLVVAGAMTFTAVTKADQANFIFTGGVQSWVVPTGVSCISTNVCGGGGAGGFGGASVNYDGGASSSISIGGGFSLDNRIVVAGGGGGSGRINHGGDAGYIGSGVGHHGDQCASSWGSGGNGFGGPGGAGYSEGGVWGFGSGSGGNAWMPSRYGGSGGGGYGGGGYREFDCETGGAGGSISTGSNANYSSSGGIGGAGLYRGGNGAQVVSIFYVTPGETVFIYVGGGAKNPNFSNSSGGGNGRVEITFCQHDFDGSGVIDSSDIGLMLLDFGSCSSCPTDLDGSGEVDPADIGLLLLDMGACS